MLKRSFKPAKCKTALKLAVSRIKLMKNKMTAHHLQLRREVAQLLASGQERTARIRVEHVVREEKTIAAYDLLEVYCELIVARLSMIESQKNCPIDLKEAVTSVIFASQRCADLPELQDIRRYLQSKYGKEFSTAAIELRPGCGVSRLMIEKLSVAPPDAQSKTKILSAIALEHSINWDPKTSGENEEKPPEDLLNGPNTFLRASQKYEESPVQAPIVDTPKHDAYIHETPSSPPVSQNFESSATSSTYQSQQHTSNVRAEKMEHRSGDHKLFAAGKQNWNMEFTDATSAAHAAAEAAELASMAARAAVQLSNDERIARQKSSEASTQRLPVNNLRNASFDKHTVSTKSNPNVTKDPANNFDYGVDSRMENENFSMNNYRKPHPEHDAAFQKEGLGTFSGKSQMSPDRGYGNDKRGTYSNTNPSPGEDHFGTESGKNSRVNLKVQGTNTNGLGDHIRESEQLNQPVHIRGSSQSDSLKYNASFPRDEMFHNNYSQENIFSHSGQPVEREKYIAGEEGLEKDSNQYQSTEDENINYFADEILHGRSNSDSSGSRSLRHEDDQDDCFLDKSNDSEHGNFQARSNEVVFDNSGSEDDVGKIDFTGGFNNEDPDPFRSLNQRSPKGISWVASDTSNDESVPKPVFANNESSSNKLFIDPSDTMGSSRSNESLPVAFDQSDSEVELEGSDHVELSTQESLRRHTSFGAGSNNCMIDEDELQHHVSFHAAFSDKKSKSTMDSSYTRQYETSIERPSLDTGKELNLPLISGGLRNKGKKSPVYTKFPLDVTSLPSDEVLVNDSLVSPNRTFTDFVRSVTQRTVGLQQSRRADKNSNPRLKAQHYDLVDESDSEDELPQMSIKHSPENAPSVLNHKSSSNFRSTYSDSDKILKEEDTTGKILPTNPHIGSSSIYSHNKTSVSSRSTYLNKDNLQSEEEATVQESHSNHRPGGELSRRTKTSTPGGRRKPSRETYDTTSLSHIEPQTTELEDHSEIPKLTRPRKSAPEVKRQPTKPSSSNNQMVSSSNHSPKPSSGTASSSNPKAEQTPTRQDSIKKASHVHPKLPDFDTLAAHFSSLRKDSK